MVEKEKLKTLREEVKKHLDSGKTIPEIGSALLKAGYEREEVDEIVKPYVKYDTQSFAAFSILWGLVGLIYFPVIFLGPVLGIGGIIFAIRSKRNERGNLWKIGLVISILAILAQPLYFLF